MENYWDDVFEDLTTITSIIETDDILPESETIWTAVALAMVIALTVFGNCLVVIAVFTYKRLQSVQNVFLVSLAVADIAVALLVMPLSVASYLTSKWTFGKGVCKMWLTCDVMCCTASILNLGAIALDRYWAISDPINYASKRTLKRVLVIITIVWTISFCISLPPLLGWNDWPDTFTEDTPCQLSEDKGYVLFSAIGAFFIPLLVMMTVYFKIFVAVKQRIRIKIRSANKVSITKYLEANSAPNAPAQMLSVEISSTDAVEESIISSNASACPQHSEEKRDEAAPDHQHGEIETAEHPPENPPTPVQNGEKFKTKLNSTVRRYVRERQKISLLKERRAARVLGIVMGAFLLCWLPFFIMYVTLPFCGDLCQIPSRRVIYFLTWLGYVNSSVNPLIYTVFNMDFRRAFTRMLCGQKPKG